MDAAWPAVESTTAHGWKLRSAGSVTQRANSIWPRDPGGNAAAALHEAASWYSQRRQPVIFQMTRRPEHAGLESALDELRFSRQSETLIMTASAGNAPPATSTLRMDVSQTPSPAWLELWWLVDGRGGPAQLATAESIMRGAPALYATAFDAEGHAVGTGRLALPKVDDGGGWGGIYAMAVHPQMRRRGIGTEVLAALLHAAREAGAGDYWLMVAAANAGAQALYARAGFAEVARYHYRQAPVRWDLGAY